MLPTVQGPAIKRSGTRFVKDVKTASLFTRLVAFEFGTTQAYILEFGNLYCRVYKDSGGVLETGIAIAGVAAATPINVNVIAHGYATGDQVFISGSAVTGINSCYFHVTNVGANNFTLDGTASLGAGGAGGTSSRVHEFSTNPASATGGYTTAELETLQFTQSADVLYIACPTKPRRKISRTGHTSWLIEDIVDEAPPFSQENLDLTDYMAASATTGTVSLFSTGGHFVAGHIGGYVKLAETLEANYPEWKAGTDTIGAFPAPHLNSLTTYRVGAVALGNAPNLHIQYQGRLYRVVATYGGTLTGGAPPLHETGTQNDGQWDWTYVNSGYGWVQITAVTDGYFATGTVVRELGPSVAPTAFAINAVANVTPVQITTALAHSYATGDIVFIRNTGVASLNNRTYLITVTGAALFTLQDPVTGANIAAAGAAGAGGTTSRVRSTSLGTLPLRARREECTRWAFSAFSTERGFPTAVAFFEDRLWWAGTAADPQGLWASRTGRYEDHLYTSEDDGALFLLLNTQQVNRIEWLSSGRRLAIGTAGGEFVLEAAATGPITAGNALARQQTYFGSRSAVAPVRVEAVTLFVQRSGRKLIEFAYDTDTDNYQGADLTVLSHHLALSKIRAMAWAQEPDRVLWVVFQDGTLAGLTYDRGQEVVGWHPHTIGGASVAVESVAVIPHPDGNRSQVWFVVKRTVNGSVKRHVEYLEQTWLSGTAIADAFFVDAGLTYSGAPTANILGLWHLLNTQVRVLLDGVAYTGTVTATTGTIDLAANGLPTGISKAQVGLAFAGELEPMLLEAGGADGTAQGKTKRATGIVLRLEDTGTGLTYGVQPDQLAIPAGTLVTDDTEILPWPDGYTKRQRLPIAHSDPTPCTLVAMFPQVVTEDR